MAEGFQLNSGVGRRMGRELPQGDTRQLPALGVPTSVPFVQPARPDTDVQPNAGALRLARTLGGINFGALATSFAYGNAQQRRKQEEAASDAAQAETARILAETGQDFEALVAAGKIPLHKSPAGQLGQSIAVANAATMKLRQALSKRDPNAANFYSDTEFMTPFYESVKGLRPEAVVKYFIEPVQQLAEDDDRRIARNQEVQFQQKTLQSTVETLQGALSMGDDISKALSSSLNTLKIGGQATPENVKVIMTSLAPAMLDSARDPSTGEINMAKITSALNRLSKTRVQYTGGRQEFSLDGNGAGVAGLYYDAFSALETAVYSSVYKQNQAWHEQLEVKEKLGKSTFVQKIAENPESYTTASAIVDGVGIGLSAEDSLKIFKAVAGSPGVTTGSDEQEAKFENDWTAYFRKLSVNQLEDLRTEVFSPSNPMSDTEKAIQGKLIEKELSSRRAASGGVDSYFATSKGTSAIATAFEARENEIIHLGGVKSNNLTFNSWLQSKYGQQAPVVKKQIVAAVTPAIMRAAARHPRYAELQSAVAAAATDPSLAGTVEPIQNTIINDVLTQGGENLGKQLYSAMSSRDPITAIQKLEIDFGQTRNPQAQPAPPRPSTRRRSTSVKPAASPLKQAAVARKSADKPGNQFYGMFRQQLLKSKPELTDKQVRHIFSALTPAELNRLYQAAGGSHGTR